MQKELHDFTTKQTWENLEMDIMEYYYPIAYRMTVDYKTILKHIQSGLEIDSPHFQS